MKHSTQVSLLNIANISSATTSSLLCLQVNIQLIVQKVVTYVCISFC